MIAPPPKSGGPLLRIILFLLMTLPTFAKDPCPPLNEPGHFRTCQRWAFTQLHVEARKTYRAEVEFHDVVDGIRFPIKVDDLHGWPDLYPRILAAPLLVTAPLVSALVFSHRHGRQTTPLPPQARPASRGRPAPRTRPLVGRIRRSGQRRTRLLFQRRLLGLRQQSRLRGPSPPSRRPTKMSADGKRGWRS